MDYSKRSYLGIGHDWESILFIVTRDGTIKKRRAGNFEHDGYGPDHSNFFSSDYNRNDVIASGRIDEVEQEGSFAINQNGRGVVVTNRATERMLRTAASALSQLMAEYPHVEWIVFDGPSLSASEWFKKISQEVVVESVDRTLFIVTPDRRIETRRVSGGAIHYELWGDSAYEVAARGEVDSEWGWITINPSGVRDEIDLITLILNEFPAVQSWWVQDEEESEYIPLPKYLKQLDSREGMREEIEEQIDKLMDEFSKKFGFSQRKEYSPGEFIREHGMRDQIENQIEEIISKKRKYFVFISNQYFPPEIRKRGPGKEDFEQWFVLASSRRDAAERVWEKHGKRLLSLMEPNRTRFPRKVSLFVDDPVRQQKAGRLPPIQVSG